MWISFILIGQSITAKDGRLLYKAVALLLFKLAFHATTNSSLVLIQARNSNFIYMMSCIEGRLVKEKQIWNGQWIKSKLLCTWDVLQGRMLESIYRGL